MSMDVLPIGRELYAPWLLNVHYAKTIPTVDYAFGLFLEKAMQGCITFGRPANPAFNDGFTFVGHALQIRTLELNRLVVAEDLPKNTLSMFVSRSLKMLPPQCLIVSYADSNYGHKGYIYQATNWLYLGETKPERVYIVNGKAIHGRVFVHNYGTRDPEKIPLNLTADFGLPEHRYLYIRGNKKLRREVLRHLHYEILPYPKGDNDRYDIHAVSRQGLLF